MRWRHFVRFLKVFAIGLCCLLAFQIFQPNQQNQLLNNELTADNDNFKPTMWKATKESGKSDVTVVTAYFDIGAFPKGRRSITFSNQTYIKWVARFRYMVNPVILYTDSKPFAEVFNNTRNQLKNLTKIILIDRNTSWAFQRRDKIAAIFADPHYPKHLPNTVIPEYACAQLAKYDVISRAARANMFETKYIMWLDIGYFRDRLKSIPFVLERPKDFNDSRIGVNLVYFHQKISMEPERIFKGNIVWVGGGVVFGERNLVISYEKQFMKAVDYFISKGLMNSDQQVTYAMFSDEGRKALKPEIDLHVHKPINELDWFGLGYSMLRELE